MLRALKTVAVVALLALLVAACADDDDTASQAEAPSSESVQVTDVWARASAGMQRSGAVYMTITAGDADVSLIGVAVPTEIAGRAMLHESAPTPDGAMTMSPVTAIEIPAGTSVALEPGGYHVMAMPLVEALVVGAAFDVTLIFSDGTEVTVQAEVRDE